MSVRSKLLTVVCLILVPGSVFATLGYARYLRSTAYRRATEARLSDRLGMCVSVGAIRPLALGSRALEDVRVHLAEQGLEVFSCSRAVWNTRTHGQRSEHVLVLSDGSLLVGTAGWSRADYERMLAGGLGHDFAELGLAEVHLKGIDLRFTHPAIEFTAAAAAGTVLFDDAGDGQASLTCFRLNGFDVEQPVNITLRFTPGDQLTFHEVRLTVPPIPLAALGFEDLLDEPVSCGGFDGTIVYRNTGEEETVEVTGSLYDADLQEFTDSVPGGPFRGTIDVELDEATFAARELRSLSVHGQVCDLRLGELVPVLAGASSGGRLELKIDQLRWEDGRLAHLSARGVCDDVSLDGLSSLWGPGTITGSGTIKIGSLLVVEDRLHFADVEIVATPPEDEAGLIDRALIARVAQEWLGFDISAALPEQVEYVQLGARLIIDGDQLHVLGTHGHDGRTILTVQVLGRPWGIIRQPKRTFAVPDLLDLIRRRADEVDTDQLETWWERLHGQEDPGS